MKRILAGCAGLGSRQAIRGNARVINENIQMSELILKKRGCRFVVLGVGHVELQELHVQAFATQLPGRGFALLRIAGGQDHRDPGLPKLTGHLESQSFICAGDESYFFGIRHMSNWIANHAEGFTTMEKVSRGSRLLTLVAGLLLGQSSLAPPMVFVIIGPPGSGKSTQSKLL